MSASKSAQRAAQRGRSTASDMLAFQGTVKSRTGGSKVTGRAPSETEILALNPNRKTAILEATGWSDLIPGTLNLIVDEKVVSDLLMCEPLWREKPEEVTYPQPYAHVPKQRGGYLYFGARIRNGAKMARALIRCGAVNPLKNVVEAFSDLKLREVLALSDETQVLCEVDSKSPNNRLQRTGEG